MKRHDKARVATAYHEAGHAFADWHFHYRLKKAMIVPDRKNNSAGSVSSKCGLPFRLLETTKPTGSQTGRFHERIVSLMAGVAAQHRYRRNSVRSHHGKSDRAAIADLLFHFHSAAEMPHVIRYLEAKAKVLVENPMHWFVIKHLAGELLKRRILSGEEVETIIREGHDLHFRKAIKNRARAVTDADSPTAGDSPPLGNP